MAELTFVGLAVLAWTMAIMAGLVALAMVAFVFHVIRTTISDARDTRRVARARKEMLERERKIDAMVKDDQFFKEIEAIFHER